MYTHNGLANLVEVFWPLIKEIISEVKLDRLRFNVGKDGIYISRLTKNGKIARLEIPFDISPLPEQT